MGQAALFGSDKKAVQLCRHIRIEDLNLSLNKNERILVCGKEGSEGEAWSEIPLPQAQLEISGILQSLGYLKPRFERQGDQLVVWAGDITNIKHLVVNGGTPPLDPSRKRKIIGYPLTPAKLDEVQTWADTGLRSSGYACPKLDVKAQAWDESIVLGIDPGTKKKIREFRARGLGQVDPKSIDRYRPFESGDEYDVRKTQILNNRLLYQGLFQSAYVLTDCVGDQVDLTLETAIGPPRILRFGVGASTEEFPFMTITFRNAQLDNYLSSMSASLHVSPIEQRINVSSDLYWIPGSVQSYFGPRFSVQRKKERSYEVEQAKLGGDIGRDWDFKDTRAKLRGGPTFNVTDTLSGFGPEAESYLSWEASLSLNSHLYEVHVGDQFYGWTADFRYRGQRKGFGSPINVNRYEFEAKHLWNLNTYAPPLLVLGTRVELIGVDASLGDDNAAAQSADQLPADYRLYYGGDRNLRGFSRESINNNGRGYLMGANLGFELRLVEQLPWKLQPFLLYDLARVGVESWKLDDALFISEGLGIRWASPFGVLRGSYALGRIEDTAGTPQNAKEEWVFFFSFGQEF